MHSAHMSQKHPPPCERWCLIFTSSFKKIHGKIQCKAARIQVLSCTTSLIRIVVVARHHYPISWLQQRSSPLPVNIIGKAIIKVLIGSFSMGLVCQSRCSVTRDPVLHLECFRVLCMSLVFHRQFLSQNIPSLKELLYGLIRHKEFFSD